jgi:hypothetical protein
MEYEIEDPQLKIYRWRIINNAERLCNKFMAKVETGKARSVETYEDCKHLKEDIDTYYKYLEKVLKGYKI